MGIGNNVKYDVLWDGVCHRVAARDANLLLLEGLIVHGAEPHVFEATMSAMDYFKTPAIALAELRRTTSTQRPWRTGGGPGRSPRRSRRD